MFRGEITVSQGFFHAILYLLGGVLQLHALQLSNNRIGLFAGRVRWILFGTVKSYAQIRLQTPAE